MRADVELAATDNYSMGVRPSAWDVVASGRKREAVA
jgi:hypothetical protein